MINDVYITVQSLLNKDSNGYISPEEFNLFSQLAQQEIFNSYFTKENRDKVKKAAGMSNRGYGNLEYILREKINQFSAEENIAINTDKFDLPSDLYHIEDNGITTSDGKVVTEAERHIFSYLNGSSVPPSLIFPIYERYSNYIKISPDTIDEINVKYIRKPKAPKWTYTVISNQEFFNQANGSYQDFELHPSEFANLVVRILGYCGVSIREEAVVQYTEQLKDKSVNQEEQ